MNEEFYIYENNGDIKEAIKILKEHGYNYIVKACDKWLSGWGGAENRKHLQLIACKTREELHLILQDLENDKSFNYIDWNRIDNYKSIYNWTRGKSYTIRNEWARAFK